MKGKIRFVALSLCVAAVFSSCGSKAPSGGKEYDTSDQYTVTAEELYDASEDRACWLAIPDSELVINPFNYLPLQYSDYRQSMEFDRDMLMIDVGLLHYASKGNRIESALALAAKNPYGGYLFSNDYEIGWQPDRLLYEANYDTGLSVEAYDYFYDENTIVRNIYPDGEGLTVWGAYSAMNPESLRFKGDILTYRRTDGVTVSIAFSCEGKWSFFSSIDKFKSLTDKESEPSQAGVWCFEPTGEANVVSTSLSFGTTKKRTEEIVAAGKKPFKNNDFVTAAGKRTEYWNDYLAKVPMPASFELPLEDTYGVSADDVKRYYYRSWALIISNLLPANENFAYTSLATGKASMWSEGSSECKYAAVWEGMFGAQMYSYIDPEIAWDLCLGYMSIIPADGNIAGESLPSIKAHTVWVCYEGLKDKQKLLSCVEPLENYFEWRYKNPRWILGDYDNPDEKDMDFVPPLLIDLKFMVRICNELGLTDKAAYWSEKAATMYQNMIEWFYKDRAVPLQRLFLKDMRTSVGTPFWIGKALWVDELEGETAQRTVDYIVEQYDPSLPFCGFASVKYDSWAYNLYGLTRYGRGDIAADMAQAGVRDVIRCGFIGEVYNANGRGLVCEGVRPSMFGAMILIDCLWLINGYMYHEGGIGAINLYDHKAGLTGIVRNGINYEIAVDGTVGKVKITANGEVSEQELALGDIQERIV